MQRAGWLLVAGMGLLTHSATIVWDIRWLPLHVAGMVLVAFSAVGEWRSGKNARWPMVFLSLLAVGWIVGAFRGPATHRALLYALPGLFAVFTGVGWMGGGARAPLSVRSIRLLFAGYLLAWCGISLWRFLGEDVLPAVGQIRKLDKAAGGGLFGMLLGEALPTLRNAHPMGHQNYLSGFLLVALPLLAEGVLRGEDRVTRLLSGWALGAGGLVLLTLQSRNTLMGLVSGGVALWIWMGRGRAAPPRRLFVGLGSAAVLMLLLSPRLWKVLTVFTPARLGIWWAAILTGWRYFPWGCGEGLAPEMLHLLTPELPDRWPAVLQFHQSWLHFWAVAGVPGALGILGLSGWILWRLFEGRSLAPEQRTEGAASVFALGATVSVMVADYQWDVYPITILLMYHLAVLGRCRREAESSGTRRLFWLMPSAVCLATALTVLPAALRSRSAVDAAGLAAERGEVQAAVAEFERAFAHFPEAYSLNMAGQLLARDPGKKDKAMRTFEHSLQVWEAQPVAHDFLAELYFRRSEAAESGSSEARNALERALEHAERVGELAPELRGAHTRVARVALQLGRSKEEVFAALTREMKETPDLMFPAVWQAQPDLAPLQEEFLRYFLSLRPDPGKPEEVIVGRRQAWMLLLGLAPEGRGQPDPEFLKQVERAKRERNSFRLLARVCEAPDEAAADDAARRLLIYLLRQPVNLETARGYRLAAKELGKGCETGLLLAGQAGFTATSFRGIGILSHHPRSLPMPRPGRVIDSLGARFYPR